MTKKENENEKENEKETKTEENKEFDLQFELGEIQKPDFLKRAFVKLTDTQKIKSKSDLEKLFKKFLEG